MTLRVRQLTAILGLALLALAPWRAQAGVAIDLVDGGTVVASSYRVEGNKLLAYRASGVLELQRSAVKAIRETGDDGASDNPTAAPPPLSGGEAEAAVAPGQPAGLSPAEERERRERVLSRKIILAHRDLLFARNRGEPKGDIERRSKEIDKLEAERSSLR